MNQTKTLLLALIVLFAKTTISLGATPNVLFIVLGPHIAMLPWTAGIDVEGFDFTVFEPLLDGLGNELEIYWISIGDR